MNRREMARVKRVVPHLRVHLTPAVLVVFTTLILTPPGTPTEASVKDLLLSQEPNTLRRKIDFISTKRSQRTPSPPGWEAYNGAVYTPERGYGWLIDLAGCCGDKGGVGKMILPDGTKASPQTLGRSELAHWQGTHKENQPLVFRIDLANGWYRVTCTSVDPDNAPLPLVDQRSIKFRAHDVVFAGPRYGAPLAIEGHRLIEGSGVVEVTEGHLRIVVGDPAYGGWTWSYEGPWHRGWRAWFGKWRNHRYAETWYQKLTRTVDPGFHSLRFNSLEIEQVSPPVAQPLLFFRDFFNRDDNADINVNIPESHRWMRKTLHPTAPGRIIAELYKTSVKLTALRKGHGIVGIVQQQRSPEARIVRYSTSVSLFTGEGSRIHSGIQEAGLLILGESPEPTEFNSTFVGVAYDWSQAETPGWLRYRVGNGRDGYRTDAAIPDTVLPFKVAAGEYEIIVEHDVPNNLLSRVHINGVDITGHWAPSDRRQRIARGLFGIRALMDAHGSGVPLQQFYWYYRVDEDQRSS
jgi:hypothetical protein